MVGKADTGQKWRVSRYAGLIFCEPITWAGWASERQVAQLPPCLCGFRERGSPKRPLQPAKPTGFITLSECVLLTRAHRVKTWEFWAKAHNLKIAQETWLKGLPGDGPQEMYLRRPGDVKVQRCSTITYALDPPVSASFKKGISSKKLQSPGKMHAVPRDAVCRNACCPGLTNRDASCPISAFKEDDKRSSSITWFGLTCFGYGMCYVTPNIWTNIFKVSPWTSDPDVWCRKNKKIIGRLADPFLTSNPRIL